jgi:hypothetical protein
MEAAKELPYRLGAGGQGSYTTQLLIAKTPGERKRVLTDGFQELLLLAGAETVLHGAGEIDKYRARLTSGGLSDKESDAALARALDTTISTIPRPEPQPTPERPGAAQPSAAPTAPPEFVDPDVLKKLNPDQQGEYIRLRAEAGPEAADRWLGKQNVPSGGTPAPEPGTGLVNPVQTGVPGVVSGAKELPPASPRAEADRLEAQHVDALRRLQDAQGRERRALNDRSMGLNRTQELADAKADRLQAQKDVKALARQLDDAHNRAVMAERTGQTSGAGIVGGEVPAQEPGTPPESTPATARAAEAYQRMIRNGYSEQAARNAVSKMFPSVAQRPGSLYSPDQPQATQEREVPRVAGQRNSPLQRGGPRRPLPRTGSDLEQQLDAIYTGRPGAILFHRGGR